MRRIPAGDITAALRRLVVQASQQLEPDLLDALLLARDRETSALARGVLDLLLINADSASREQLPLCHDTGMPVVFVQLGQEVQVEGDLQAAIQQGLRQGSTQAGLRLLLCDPVSRRNTGDNTPGVLHTALVPGDRCRIDLLLKGCGSENQSALGMLSPAAGPDGVIDFVVTTVLRAGADACPPLLVGVGVGGSFEQAALMAKQALLRPLDEPQPDPVLAELEGKMLRRLNAEGCGVQGLGGCTTALAVHLVACPTHIAALPVAVNLQCHAHRRQTVTL